MTLFTHKLLKNKKILTNILLPTTSVGYWLLLSCLLLMACNGSRDYSPKPKGYPRIDLPKPEYQPLAENHPYFFEYSKYAVIRPDTFARAEPHWIFVHYPAFNANVQLTYKPVLNSPERLQKMIDDAHRLTFRHEVKASAIQEAVMKTKTGKTAGLLILEGEVPSPFQFYVTDSTKYFLRGALYFNTATANDSLAPVIDYVKKDIIRMLNTLQWRK